MEKRAGLYDWSLGNNNELHRLIGGTHLGQALLFDYDANSNRLFSSVDGEQTDLVVDTESNQITQVGDNTLDYDLNGNIILDGVNAYGYDAKNRFTNFNNGQVLYTHNAFGLRVKKTFPANAPNAAQSTGNHIEDDFTGSDDTDILTRADNTWASNGKGSALIKGNQANLIDGIALSQSVGTLNEDDSYSLNAKLTQGEISVSSGGSEIVNVRYGFGRNLFITAQGLDEALNVNTSIYKDKLDVNVTWKAGEVVVTVTGTDGTEHTTGTITNSNIKEGEAQSVQLRDYFSGFYTQIFGKTVFIDDVTVVGSNTPTTPEPVNNDRLYHYNDAGLLTTEFDGDGNILLEHVYLGSTPVAVIKGGTTYFVHVDHLGTPRSITRQNNTVVWGWESKPFGDDAVTDLIGLEYNIRMAGQYEDLESGLFYNCNRTYSPKTGRYLESDPIGLQGGLNTYGYVGGNPNSFVDPMGLLSLSAGDVFGNAPPIRLIKINLKITGYAGKAIYILLAVSIANGVDWATGLSDRNRDVLSPNQFSDKVDRRNDYAAYKAFQRTGYTREDDPCRNLRNRIDYHKELNKRRIDWDSKWPHSGFPNGQRHADVIAKDSANIQKWEKEYREMCSEKCK